MTDPGSDQNYGHWLRLLWMLLFFYLIFYALKLVIAVTALTQFILVIVNSEPNETLKSFSGRINRYSYEILQFLTFNKDRKPFPFSEFPDAD
ncbi:MAG: hypothetical protein ACI8P9_003045 [Parasphingorhabdus sp.]|jgi:hypothetical protein